MITVDPLDLNKNQAGFLCVRQLYWWFTLQNLATNLGACKPTSYTVYTSRMRWISTRGTVFIKETSDNRMQYFTILHSFNIRDHRSMCGVLAKPLKKNSKITNTASRFSLLQPEMWSSVWMNINRVTLEHNKEFIMYFLFNAFIYV